MSILDTLLNGLLQENPLYQKQLKMPEDEETKKKLFYALCTIRKPGYTKYVDETWMQLQDAFLQEELQKKGGVVSVNEIPSITEQYQIAAKPMYLQKKMDKNAPFTLFHSDKMALYKGDITRLDADAIVNAANEELLGCFTPGHKCIDNVIHSAAGIALRQECYTIRMAQKRPEPNGFAKITKGYNLPAKYVIHTVGPRIYDTVADQDETELRSCYHACLSLAEENQLESIAFCCIATGEFHFPKALAAGIAIQTADEFLDTAEHIKKIIFDVYTEEDYQIYKTLINQYAK